MRLRHIEVFHAVMLTGSVSGAARLMNVTQPAVSRLLQHAELQLGFPLFQREKGRLAATSEALTLYPHIERLFAQLDDVQRLAATLKAGRQHGELRVLTVLALSYELLPRAIAAFRREHPDVRITMQSLHSPQIMSALLLQEADLGLVFSPVVHPALVAEPLAQARMVCVVPQALMEQPWRTRHALTLADLVDRPIAGLDMQDPVGRSLGQACREAGVGLDYRLTVQTYHAALALAHHGLGIALVDSCTALSADPQRVTVLALEPPIAVPVNCLRSAARPDSVAARAFVRHVRQTLEQVLPPAG